MIQHVDIAFRGFGSPVQAAFKALAGPSQKEVGALRYDVYEEPDPHSRIRRGVRRYDAEIRRLQDRGLACRGSGNRIERGSSNWDGERIFPMLTLGDVRLDGRSPSGVR
jgi:hypothetical protein